MEGSWKPCQGAIKENRGNSPIDDLHVIGEKRQQLVGRTQEHYGTAKDVPDRQVDVSLKLFDETRAPVK